MQTKQELLDRMKALDACEEATDWVEAHESDSAVEIWLSCPEVGWLIWFGGRQNPKAIAAFAKRCAERAKGYAAANANAADYAARAAGYAARVADAAEWKLQLDDLIANVNEYLGG